MNKIIDLKIYTPIEIFLDEEVRKLTFQGREGYVTILPNHIDYVSSFDSNIMHYTDANGKQKFIALNNGLLVKYSNRVRLTAYKAILGDSIGDLRAKISETVLAEGDTEKEINKNLKQLEYYMFNKLMDIEMKLNESLEKVAKNKKEKPDKNISLAKFQLLTSLGIRIALIYLFFIFMVGKVFARLFGYNNLYLLAIILATLTSIYILFDVVKKLSK